MTHSEFSLIDHFFKRCPVRRDDVVIGIGDDAAVTHVEPGMQLVSAIDTLVNRVHFPEDTLPYDIGYKSLAVNLSDLAAMGAEPVWATLAITMPQADEGWLQGFCDGFFDLAKQFNVQLIGGDTTQGPLTVTVQVMGVLPEGTAMTRGGARSGESIFISGYPGDAALGLAIKMKDPNCPELNKEQQNLLVQKLNRPLPQLALGVALRGIASAAIDISDGLAADLTHILQASNMGATIQWQQIPLSSAMQKLTDVTQQHNYVLGGGDDYELCFTAPVIKRSEVLSIARQLNIKVTEIGIVEEKPGLRLFRDGAKSDLLNIGFEHFSIP